MTVRTGTKKGTRGPSSRRHLPSSRKRLPSSRKRVLAVDVGGTHVKMRVSGRRETREFESGPKLGARDMVAHIHEMTGDWVYDAVSMGYPGVVMHGVIMSEPHNLASGWVGFDFRKAFGRPIRILNDAAMQAIGSYDGGRMLFLGLGTGLGSCLIVDGIVAPMELAHLSFKKGRSYEAYLGVQGLRRLGVKKWRRTVADVIGKLSAAFEVDYVVLGGGNARKLKRLPRNGRLGSNEFAFTGGFRVWRDVPQAAAKPSKRILAIW
jgi:polyphosphate glucokinase